MEKKQKEEDLKEISNSENSEKACFFEIKSIEKKKSNNFFNISSDFLTIL